MNIAEARRYSRHVALAELGPEGQTRILNSVVALVVDIDGDLALQTAALYLCCSGVREFRVLVPANQNAPEWLAALEKQMPEVVFVRVSMGPVGSHWAAALAGCAVAVRASFADDSFVDACRRGGIAAVVARVVSDEDDLPAQLDLLSLRPAACTLPSPVPSVPPSPPAPVQGPLAAAASVTAGAMSAAEALWLIVGRLFLSPDSEMGTAGVIRHLNVSLSIPHNAPSTHNIPWHPVPLP